MKKKFSLLIVLILVATFVTTILAGCVDEPESIDETRIDYGVAVLADLTDYSSTATSASIVYNPTAIVDVRNKLSAKILSEKSYYDAYYSTPRATQYRKYTKDDLTTGTLTDLRDENGDGVADEQTSLVKILAHSDANQLLKVLGYSALSEAKMSSLVTYLAEDGSDAKTTNKHTTTGLLEDYSAIRDWTDELDALSESDASYKEIYKTRAHKSRAMNKRIFDTGMDGGDASRALIEVLQYVQIVVQGMRDTYVNDNPTISSMTVNDYFKRVLLDYDTIVIIRAINDVRWQTEGQTLEDIVKEVVLLENSYNGSYTKPTTDSLIVKGYGYSYDYEKANYNALSDADFEKELEYRFLDTMSDEQAKDFRRIQRQQYANSYRYSDTFYSNSFYPSLDPINAAQEKYEAKVYGFVNDDRAETYVNTNNLSGAGTMKVVGAGGNYTEDQINILIGIDIGSYATETKEGVKVGIASQLKFGDIEYYFWGLDENTTAQASAQRDYKSNDSATSLQGEFNTKLLNLKMGDLVLNEFILDDDKQGLSNLMMAQTRGYKANYIRSIKALRRSIVKSIAKLVKDGALEENYIDNSVSYVALRPYTDAEKIVVRDEIGKQSALIDSLYNNLAGLNLTSVSTNLNNTDWQTIETQVKATIDYDYSAISTGWGNKLKAMEDTLIKKTYNETTGEYDYDTNWATSVFLSNNERVLRYTSGQVRVEYYGYTQLNSNGTGFTSARKYTDYGYSGDKLLDMLPNTASFTNFTTTTTPNITYGLKTSTSGTGSKGNWYLRYIYQNGEHKYFYQIQEHDIIDYDLYLYAEYEVK